MAAQVSGLASDPKQMTGVGLMGGAALLGILSLFFGWAQFFGFEVFKPVDCYSHFDHCFDGNGMMAGIGAVLMLVAIVLLAIAAVMGAMGPRKGIEMAFTADVVATIAVIVLAIGINNVLQTFPTYIGFWLGLGMVILAFIGPILMKQARAQPAMGIAMPGVPMMRATSTPAGAAKPMTAGPAGSRRLKCPKCANLVVVGPGQRPACSKCGFKA